MKAAKLRLEKSWSDALLSNLPASELRRLWSFVEKEYAGGKQIFPTESEIFAALDLTPFDRVKVVLLGQDPYFRPGQAHGLCFSVPKGVKPPRSLQMIFSELGSDVRDFKKPASGDLTPWAKQGVLLLNMALTVEEGASGSHQEQWRFFTEAIIRTLAAKKQNLVFIAWGNKAQEAVEQIDRNRHEVLECPHPSSRRGGFRRNGHFNLANKYLVGNGNAEIDWRLD